MSSKIYLTLALVLIIEITNTFGHKQGHGKYKHPCGDINLHQYKDECKTKYESKKGTDDFKSCFAGCVVGKTGVINESGAFDKNLFQTNILDKVEGENKEKCKELGDKVAQSVEGITDECQMGAKLMELFPKHE